MEMSSVFSRTPTRTLVPQSDPDDIGAGMVGSTALGSPTGNGASGGLPRARLDNGTSMTPGRMDPNMDHWDYVAHHDDDGTSDPRKEAGQSLLHGSSGSGGHGGGGVHGGLHGSGSAPHLGVLAHGWPHYLRVSLKAIMLGEPGHRPWLNMMVVCLPVAMFSEAADWGDVWTFLLSLMALMPFAVRLVFVTEQMASYTNETVGGLLSATFGNATELIVSFSALRSGLLRVVQVSLLGAILANLLLVLGAAFLFGGIRYTVQQYNKTAASVNSALLLMAVMGMMLPAVLNASHTSLGNGPVLMLSRLSSIGLFIVYGCYLIFQLKTHQHLFQDGAEHEKVTPVLGFWGSAVWLGIFATAIAVLSEYMVNAMAGAASALGMSTIFIGTIVFPLVGSSAEFASAVMFARRNKMDMSVAVTVGSSTQVALFVVPFCVLMGWMIGQPLTLDFHVFETATVMIVVLILSFIIGDGSSNWLVGLMLIVAYLLVAVAFFVHT